MGTVVTGFNNVFAAGSNVVKANARALGSTIEAFFSAPYRLTNNSTNPTAASGYVLQLVGADTTASFLEVDTFGAMASTRYRRAEGTSAAPTATVASTILGAVEFCGYYTSGGTAYTDGKAQVRGVAAENWTSSANGSQVEIWTTPNTTSTLTKALTIGQDQSVLASGILGYLSGTGGTVTQATNKSTGVTLNTLTGQITMNNAALSSGNEVSFTLTNSKISATDVVYVCVASGATAATYVPFVDAVAAGSCRISITNVSLSGPSEAIVLNFVVIKGQNA